MLMAGVIPHQNLAGGLLRKWWGGGVIRTEAVYSIRDRQALSKTEL